MSKKELSDRNDRSSDKQRLPRSKTIEETEQQPTPTSSILQQAGLDPRLLAPRDLKQLQRSIGNRAAGQLLEGSPPALQRQELSEEEEELQLKADIPVVGPEGGPVAPELGAAIQSARGGGQPLEDAIQAQMGEAMGHDFSDVRVHTDPEADALNRQLSAKAFTTGQDVFFSEGAYEPGSSRGQELLAHELSHVVQQRTSQVSSGGSGVTVRPAGDIFEQEADRVADGVSTAVDTLAQRQAPRKDEVQGTPVLQRQPELEEQLEIEGGEFKAQLYRRFDMGVHDIIDKAWENIADAIRYMRAGQQEEGEYFFDLAAKRLAAFMPQPDQVHPRGLALWSGAGARDYARAKDFTVLEDTEVGGVLGVLALGAILPEWPLLRPLWDAISKQYASLPKSGPVHIFAAARRNIVQLLQSRPEEMPVLISTELNALSNKHTLLQRAGGGGVVEVWHILGTDENGNLRGIDIHGQFDDDATFDNLADAAEAMQMYYAIRE